MSTDKKRYTITLDDRLDDEVETYKFKNRSRLKTKNKAINELLALALASVDEKDEGKNKPPAADDAAEALYELLYYYLNAPPSAKQIKAFGSVIPMLCNGISGLD